MTRYQAKDRIGAFRWFDLVRVQLSDLAHFDLSAVAGDLQRLESLRQLLDGPIERVPPIYLARCACHQELTLVDGRHRLTVARERGLDSLAAIWLNFSSDSV